MLGRDGVWECWTSLNIHVGFNNQFTIFKLKTNLGRNFIMSSSNDSTFIMIIIIKSSNICKYKSCKDCGVVSIDSK